MKSQGPLFSRDGLTTVSASKSIERHKPRCHKINLDEIYELMRPRGEPGMICATSFNLTYFILTLRGTSYSYPQLTDEEKETGCKLLYTEWINSKVLLCSTGNYIQ